MCGIFCSIQSLETADSPAHVSLSDSLCEANAQRGPDAQRKIIRPIVDACEPLMLEAFASELQLRGNSPVIQPHENRGGDILCWNGEIFDGITISPSENDGVVLMQRLSDVTTTTKPNDISERVVSVLGTIEGPYALLFYHHATSTLFWARDPLGRRSLLMHQPTSEHPYFLLASVATGHHLSYYHFSEVQTDCIYRLQLGSSSDSSHPPDLPTLLGDVAMMSRRVDIGRHPLLAWDRIEPVNKAIPPDSWISLSDSGTNTAAQADPIPEHIQTHVNEFIEQLDEAVRRQVTNIPKPSSAIGAAQVAILFSGGIDSAAVAFFADRHVDENQPIDLLNVAFENPYKIRNSNSIHGKSKKQVNKSKQPTHTRVPYDVPDRITGRQEVQELRELCPKRTWNFIEVDIPYEECQKARPIIEALMYPNETVMDMVQSLAQALYFASRGTGFIIENDLKVPFASSARILLNGLGSDELLGGYGRHRSAYIAGGWEAVIRELQLELDRIPSRNLGRDDRVVSSHGKEMRHPFLDLHVVRHVSQLPVHMKLDPVAPLGTGDKMLLRLAMRQAGMIEAANRKKRAMQFGSQSARMEGEKSGEAKHPF